MPKARAAKVAGGRRDNRRTSPGKPLPPPPVKVSKVPAASTTPSSDTRLRPRLGKKSNSPESGASATVPPSASLRPSGETRPGPVGQKGGHRRVDTLTASAAQEFPHEITDHYKVYRQLQNAIVRLTLQVKSIERMIAGDQKKKINPVAPRLAAMLTEAATSPLKNARGLLQSPYKAEAKAMDSIVKALPVWEWAEGVRGIGSNILAQIIAETGDLSKYANPAKVWKRMGLALVRGHRQQFWSATRAGFTRSENVQMAEEMGYVARRRALMAVTGDCIIRAKNPHYGAIYREYKKRKLKELPPKEKGRKMHAHKMALRYIEKRFLLDLWKAWRAT